MRRQARVKSYQTSQVLHRLCIYSCRQHLKSFSSYSPSVLVISFSNSTKLMDIIGQLPLSAKNCMLSHSVMSDTLQYCGLQLPGSSVHGISQPRILEWVANFCSRGSSQPRDRTHVSCVSCIAGGFLGKKKKHAKKLVVSNFTSNPELGPVD